jgi:beta-lactamase class A
MLIAAAAITRTPAAPSAVATPTPPPAAATPRPDVRAALAREVSAFGKNAAVVVSDPLTSRVIYEHDAGTEVLSASLYKLTILLEVERRVEEGSLNYSTPVRIQASDTREGGVFTPIGAVLELDDALDQMIGISDNATALALLRMLGPTAINNTVARAGIAPFHFTSQGATASARAVAKYLELLAQKKLVSAAASERIIRRLEGHKINDRIPASLPKGTVVAHKTGNLAGVTHDAGIVYATPEQPLVVVVLTWEVEDARAVQFIRQIAALAYADATGAALPSTQGR